MKIPLFLEKIEELEELEEFRHHEETPQFQKYFKEYSNNLINDCKSHPWNKKNREIEPDTFLSERIVTKTCSINVPIKKNKFPLFSETTSRKEKH